MKKLIISTLLCASMPFCVMAQDTLSFSRPEMKLNLSKMGTPKVNLPATTNINSTHSIMFSPTISNYKPAEPLKLDMSLDKLTDSVASAAPEISTKGVQPAEPEQPYTFSLDPYYRDFYGQHLIAQFGDSYLMGYSARYAMPGLGNVGRMSVELTQTIDDKLTITAGASGMKMHFDRDAWNTFGVNGSATYQFNERLSATVFGQYYFNQTFHSVAAMGFVPTSLYGATLGYEFSNKFGVDVGAQRYYDIYSGRWHTVPILAPRLKVLGQKLSIDLGSILFGAANDLIEESRMKRAARRYQSADLRDLRVPVPESIRQLENARGGVQVSMPNPNANRTLEGATKSNYRPPIPMSSGVSPVGRKTRDNLPSR